MHAASNSGEGESVIFIFVASPNDIHNVKNCVTLFGAEVPY